jgi:competence protein ComEC
VLWSPALPGVPGPSRHFRGSAASRGAWLRRDPDVRVLWPPAAPDRSGSGPAIAGDNAASLVLEAGGERGRALLLADVDSTVEAALELEPGVALLKVAHHGSGSSSGATLLARARPAVAIVSCGRRNPFGHPAPGALARLSAAGASIVRTDREGALWFEIEPGGTRRVAWRARDPGHRDAPGPALASEPGPAR